ncbi:glycosyltransferase [Deinococcus sp. KSM4-11]|uniref:glycosyltransferase family 2 protein n=1 Tax=Deinococcus sp. KSM4-11 TaxID=2568654 RepID=UPI0010A4C766|nr:glycosyltransferase [Deinococcus sp. KSM4-11]THF87055.1 glycosyltransferase [Deinococcus sp. KSM4-11]
MSDPARPTFSIVTPTHLRPDLLLRTLASVQAQSLPDWEVLVIDDGDGSGIRAAATLEDGRIRAVPNTGTGQVAARNTGLRLARGRLIHLLDDDDRWEDDHHLATMQDTLGHQKALAHRAGWLVEEDVTPTGWTERRRRPFNPPTTADSLRRDNTLLVSGVAYPAALHAELGLFDEQVGHYWDWDWWLRVTARYSLLEAPGLGVLMSWRGSNSSSDPAAPSRVRDLRRLCTKHDLGELPSKNHDTVWPG